MKTLAIVRLPTRQALGMGDGRTLSVVMDIPRKSPVIMMITINIGVRIACPVRSKPIARKSTCTILFVTELNV